MTTYIALFNLTEAGIKAAKDSPRRLGVRLTVTELHARRRPATWADVDCPSSRCAQGFRLPPERFLLGRQAEKGGEFARVGETGHILNGRRHLRGADRSASATATTPPAVGASDAPVVAIAISSRSRRSSSRPTSSSAGTPLTADDSASTIVKRVNRRDCTRR
jgi:hypothetical protein